MLPGLCFPSEVAAAPSRPAVKLGLGVGGKGNAAKGSLGVNRKKGIQKRKIGNIFGAAAEEDRVEEMPPEARALMKNMGAQTVKAGCQSSSSGYYCESTSHPFPTFAMNYSSVESMRRCPHLWEVADMKIKDD